MHIRHKWEGNNNARGCTVCDKKEINVWGQWVEVKTSRNLELWLSFITEKTKKS